MPSDTKQTLAQLVDLRAELADRSAQLAESDALLRLLVDTVRDYAIFILDPRGYVATWNPGAERINGYRADEIIGRHFSTFYPTDDVADGKCERELEIAIREGRFEEEGWRIRKDGTRFWSNVVITALFDDDRKLLGFGKVTRDLTERKLAQEQRHAVEERFRLLIESVKDYAIFILDPKGNVATWNAGAQRIKGYRAEEIIGRHFSTFYPDEDIRAGKCEVELEVAAREGRFEDEGWRIRKDGSSFWANVVISAIYDNDVLVGYSKVTRDLTDRKRSEEERAARLAAEEANRTKDEFLAMLGHELRNPLAPIVSALQLLKLRGGDANTTREHQIIERQVKQMIRLVDDLLDVSRVSRGKIELKKQPIDLRDPLAKAVEIAIPLLEKHGHQFEVKVPQRPLGVDGDEARLTQVFANLLNNAARYTPHGGHIRLSVRHVAEQIIVEVRDDGIGIDAALLPRIFDLFVQGYQDSDRAAGGLGLGLTLVRALITMHGGVVEAHSAGRGQGSTFVVKLPASTRSVEPERDEPLPTIIPASATKRRILLVDDNEDARSLLAEMLSTAGHEVQEAGDGPAALALLDDFAPHVAILDIGLPGMDGYELARQIRESPRGESIKLLALSGYGQPPDQTRSERAGFQVHLVKPINMQRLLGQIAAVTGTKPPDDAATPSR